MQKKAFIDAVVEGLKISLPDKEIIFNEIIKNNNVRLHGVSIKDKDKDICPTVYLDKYFSMLDDEHIIEKAVFEIADLYNKKKMDNINIDLDMFKDYKKIQDKIFVCLVNSERNQGMLSNIPNRDFLNLSIIYKILVQKDEKNGIATLTINNQLLEKLDVTEQELYEQAMINTPLLFKPKAMDIMKVIERLRGEEGEILDETNNILDDWRENMIVCTNDTQCYGASVLLNKEFLIETIRKYKFTSAFIIPSSTGEIILLKDEGDREDNIRKLVEMVHEVNCSNVPEEEYLADSVYMITLEDEEVRLVESY